MNLAQLDRVKWIKSKERDIDILFMSFYMVGQDKIYYKHNHVNFEVSNHLALWNGKLFFDKQELDAAKQLLSKKGNRLGKYASKMTNQFLALAKQYEFFLKGFQNIDITAMAKVNTEKVYCELLLRYYDLIPYSFIISMILEELAQQIIEAELKHQVQESTTHYMQIMVPDKSNKSIKEYDDRLRLADYMKHESSRINVNHRLNVHLKKYSWLGCYQTLDDPWTKELLMQEISKLAKCKDPLKEIEKRGLDRKTALKISKRTVKRLKLSKDMRLLIATMQKNIWIRTYRKELMNYGHFISRPLLEYIAIKMQIPSEDLHYLACWELEDFLKHGTKVSVSEIKKRKKCWILVRLKGKTRVISGDDAKIIQLHEDVTSTVTELRGQPTYSGIIEGTVQIVRMKKDLDKFKRGKILVAPTVATWMTSAVEKCDAIVTDVGGVLSHTAIVSREFRKPCIVGTKNATEILRDGMMIRVDAINGIVKII